MLPPPRPLVSVRLVGLSCSSLCHSSSRSLESRQFEGRKLAPSDQGSKPTELLSCPKRRQGKLRFGFKRRKLELVVVAQFCGSEIYHRRAQTCRAWGLSCKFQLKLLPLPRFSANRKDDKFTTSSLSLSRFLVCNRAASTRLTLCKFLPPRFEKNEAEGETYARVQTELLILSSCFFILNF